MPRFTLSRLIALATGAVCAGALVIGAAPEAQAAAARTVPSDMTFISASQGWLLTQPTGKKPALVEHTTNGGRTWHIVGRSPFLTAYPCAKPCGTHPWAGQIRFADSRHGYLFGSSSAMTSNGGRTWTNLHRGVDALEVRGTSVIADVAHFSDPPTTENNARLMYGKVGSRTWHRAATPAFPAGPAELTRQGGVAWALAVAPVAKGAPFTGYTHLLRSTDNGVHWHATAQPKVRASILLYELGSASPRTTWLIDFDKDRLVTSHNGGRTWSAGRSIPGDTGGMTQPTSATTGFVVSENYAHRTARLLRTTDSGRHWTAVRTLPYGFGGTLTHSDPTHLHLLWGHAVYNSTDGKHWTAAPIA